MFKLLPLEERARVAHEYKLRRTVVIITALILVLIVALIGFFPSYILSRIKHTEAETLSKGASQHNNEEDLGAWLATFNKKLRTLSAGKEQETVSLAIERALAERGAGVRITQINWTESEGVAALTLTGVASDRQALLSLESRLKNSGHFSEVMLPVSNLARERDISFQISLAFKKP